MNVLFIDIDTLRPDHMGCYGYGRNTTPNIDAIAREGVRFDNYYCSDAPCLPSRAALVSGTLEERQRTVSGRELPENSETTGMTGIFIIFSGERDFIPLQ